MRVALSFPFFFVPFHQRRFLFPLFFWCRFTRVGFVLVGSCLVPVRSRWFFGWVLFGSVRPKYVFLCVAFLCVGALPEGQRVMLVFLAGGCVVGDVWYRVGSRRLGARWGGGGPFCFVPVHPRLFFHRLCACAVSRGVGVVFASLGAMCRVSCVSFFFAVFVPSRRRVGGVRFSCRVACPRRWVCCRSGAGRRLSVAAVAGDGPRAVPGGAAGCPVVCGWFRRGRVHGPSAPVIAGGPCFFFRGRASRAAGGPGDRGVLAFPGRMPPGRGYRGRRASLAAPVPCTGPVVCLCVYARCVCPCAVARVLWGLAPRCVVFAVGRRASAYGDVLTSSPA